MWASTAIPGPTAITIPASDSVLITGIPLGPDLPINYVHMWPICVITQGLDMVYGQELRVSLPTTITRATESSNNLAHDLPLPLAGILSSPLVCLICCRGTRDALSVRDMTDFVATSLAGRALEPGRSKIYLLASHQFTPLPKSAKIGTRNSIPCLSFVNVCRISRASSSNPAGRSSFTDESCSSCTESMYLP